MLSWRVFVISSATLLLASWACSSGSKEGEPTSSSSAGAGGSDSGGSSGAGTGGGAAAGGAPGSDCYEPAKADVIPGTTAEFGRDLCSPEQLEDFWASCLDDSSATSALCDPWLADAANQPCFDCLIDSDASGPIPVLYLIDDSMFILGMACEAVAYGRPECAFPNSAYVYCLVTACRSCQFDGLSDACIDLARADVCSHPALAPSPACMELVDAAIEQPLESCGGADFRAYYDHNAPFFCGPPT